MAELTDAQKVLRNDTGKRIAAAIEALGGTPPINLGMTGATPGQVPVINTVDANGAPTSYRPGAGGDGGTADALPLAGGTMQGAINMNGNKVSNLPTPTTTGDAVPKSYADNIVAVSDTQPTATENKLWVDTDAGTGTSYQIPTVAEMETADAQTAAEIGIVITGKRPSIAVTEGQYVIVRGSTISGITDGLYTANTALSPSTDVTAANLTAVSEGGLNSLSALIDAKHVPVWPALARYNSVQDIVDVMSVLPFNSFLLNPFGSNLRTDLFTTASSYDGFIVCYKASANNVYYLAYSRDVAAIGNINIPNVEVTIKHSLL